MYVLRVLDNVRLAPGQRPTVVDGAPAPLVDCSLAASVLAYLALHQLAPSPPVARAPGSPTPLGQNAAGG